MLNAHTACVRIKRHTHTMSFAELKHCPQPHTQQVEKYLMDFFGVYFIRPRRKN